MHFAYPPRKSSNPPPFRPRSARTLSPSLRRSRLKLVAVAGLAFVALVYLLARPGRGGAVAGAPARHVPTGNPPAVIVTVMDSGKYGQAFTENVKENRRAYAEKHGYATYLPHVGDYDLNGSPMSWTKVIAVRDALTKFPDATYVWYLEPDAYIMDAGATVEGDVMKPQAVEKAMIRDHPVVPPDSIIRTFSHLRGQDVDLVVTQDFEGLSPASFVVRNSEWARFFLETWFNPIYRSYNFQKAETHALEHIVQWHPTILSKLALLPQRAINSYSKGGPGEEYQPGDLVIRFPSCTRDDPLACEAQSEQFLQTWRTSFRIS